MNILHLFSNWKWTGPAELAVNLCQSLTASHKVKLITGTPPIPDMENEVTAHARERGVTVLDGFHLDKHLNLFKNLKDAFRLRRLVRAEGFDLIHCHLPNDHLLAGLAVWGVSHKPRVVRSFYGPLGPEQDCRTAMLLKRFTSGAVVFSQAGKQHLMGDFGFPGERAAVIPSAVDTARFDRQQVDCRSARQRLGYADDDFVFVIVARMQRHRKFGVLLKAMAAALAEAPGLRLLIVGRGTHQEEVAMEPVRAMNLSDQVRFTGYLQGAEFVEVLGAADAALFLVPGSDGSCRAVREKMVMGLPVIAAHTPPLDEMVLPGETGELVEVTEAALSRAMIQMAVDRPAAQQLGQQAMAFAREEYSLETQCRRMEAFYTSLIG